MAVDRRLAFAFVAAPDVHDEPSLARVCDGLGDESGLANPGLAGDGKQAGVPLVRLRQCLADDAQLGFSPHERGPRAAPWGRQPQEREARGCRSGRLGPGDVQTETSPVDDFEVAGRAAALAESASQFADAFRRDILRHDNIGPDGVEQLILGDETAGIVGEMAKNRPGFRAQRDPLAVAREASTAPVDGKWPERSYLGHARLITQRE